MLWLGTCCWPASPVRVSIMFFGLSDIAHIKKYTALKNLEENTEIFEILTRSTAKKIKIFSCVFVHSIPKRNFITTYALNYLIGRC